MESEIQKSSFSSKQAKITGNEKMVCHTLGAPWNEIPTFSDFSFSALAVKFRMRFRQNRQLLQNLRIGNRATPRRISRPEIYGQPIPHNGSGKESLRQQTLSKITEKILSRRIGITNRRPQPQFLLEPRKFGVSYLEKTVVSKIQKGPPTVPNNERIPSEKFSENYFSTSKKKFREACGRLLENKKQ